MISVVSKLASVGFDAWSSIFCSNLVLDHGEGVVGWVDWISIVREVTFFDNDLDVFLWDVVLGVCINVYVPYEGISQAVG